MKKNMEQGRQTPSRRREEETEGGTDALADMSGSWEGDREVEILRKGETEGRLIKKMRWSQEGMKRRVALVMGK